MSEVVKILIVDDHEMFLDGVKALLDGQEKFQCVATALNGAAALEILQKSPIDLMITDLSMPEMDGIELVKRTKLQFPKVKILVLSMHSNRESVGEILMSEAEGYILKNTGKRELLNALDHIHNDGTFFSRDVLSIMYEKVKLDKKKEEVVKNLTERELEILQLIVQEKSSQEIADELNISRRTVDTHRKHIGEKTNTKTIVGLLKYAFTHGIHDFNS